LSLPDHSLMLEARDKSLNPPPPKHTFCNYISRAVILLSILPTYFVPSTLNYPILATGRGLLLLSVVLRSLSHRWHHLLCTTLVHLLRMRSSTAEANFHRGLLSWPSIPITVLILSCHRNPALGTELLWYRDSSGCAWQQDRTHGPQHLYWLCYVSH
jgi:hypothetical protein